MNEEDFPSDNDTSDEDFVPNEGEQLSEEEESGEDEGPGTEGCIKHTHTEKKKKGKTKDESLMPRKRKGGIKLEEEEIDKTEDEDKQAETARKIELKKVIHQEKEEKSREAEKSKADDLWASFLSDVGPRPSPKSTKASNNSAKSSSGTNDSAASKVSSPVENGTEGKNSSGATAEDKIKIVKEYDFAGETVRITKEVSADSKEAKAEQKKKEQAEKAAAEPVAGVSSVASGVKRPGGGLGSVLGKIGKKPKISTLDKSKLDWQTFKSEEGIEEELEIHNRGKAGFIERQAFLQRTDQRQFEIERDIRLSGKR